MATPRPIGEIGLLIICHFLSSLDVCQAIAYSAIFLSLDNPMQPFTKKNDNGQNIVGRCAMTDFSRL
ncbi:MAG: hypothetical protein DDT36_01665 [Firmicutes bacterium]|nr:hypothetical protein [Bacillota bacterium]